MLPSDFFSKLAVIGYSEEQISSLFDLAQAQAQAQAQKGIVSLSFVLADTVDMVKSRGYDYAKNMLTPKEVC